MKHCWKTSGRRLSTLILPLIAGVAAAVSAHSQDDNTAEKPPAIVIADEPITVDPATLMPEQLSVNATVDLTDSSLAEIAEWVRTTTGLPVMFDKAALDSQGIVPGEPVSDELNNEPVYFVLNRLRVLGLAWFVDDNIIMITSERAAESRLSTMSYSVADLLDSGFEPQTLSLVIEQTLGGNWDEGNSTSGTVEWLGDVLFVRHNDEIHRRLRGLLSALKQHGRRTFIFDPPVHELLRQRLNENASVDYSDIPLTTAVAELAQQTGIDIRLDLTELRNARIREREPISLKLADRQLSTVLHVMLSPLKLTWAMRDGVLWITSEKKAEGEMLTAVYDVRDLCRDDSESFALRSALVSQTSANWSDRTSGGDLKAASHGALVIRQTMKSHGEVLNLLESYRAALKVSRPRKKADPDDEIDTRYYRVQTPVAESLATLLPELVAAETWKSDAHPDAPGTIRSINGGQSLITDDLGETSSSQLVEQTVLLITQQKRHHRTIEDVIRRVENGDGSLETHGMGGMGGGGFGGF
ncbi:MAG: hypothetical protein R3C19_07105 [Planctomycetaceae bacterium]